MLHQIGVGALGPVFRTYEPTRDRLVAVKVFRLDIVPEQAHALADELNHASEAGLFHPSIVEPIAAGVEGTVAYRADEYVAAESLDVAMRHYAPAPIATALPFVTQLAGAIDFARAAGVGHGGLHPRDIFVTPDEARATGFGVVESLERIGMRAPVRRPYSAPERIAGERWGVTADVFALAAIAFELLTGRRPAGAGAQPGAGGTESSGALFDVLARAMDGDPGRRHPSALAFAAALEAAARGESPRESVAVPAAAAVAASAAPRERTLFDREREEQTEDLPPEGGSHKISEEKDGSRTISDEHGAGDRISDEKGGGRPVAEEHVGSHSISEEDGEGHTASEAGGRASVPASAVESVAAAAAAAALMARVPPTPPPASEPTRTPSPMWSLERTPLKPESEAGATESLASAEDASEGTRRQYEASERSEASLPGTRWQYEASEQSEASPPERSRPAALPIAVTLVLGLLAGFAAGYFVGSRDRGGPRQTETASTSTPPAAPAAAPPSGRASSASGQPWSEQAVTAAPDTKAPATAAANPSAAAPGTPREVPPSTANTRAVTRPSTGSGRLVVQSTPSRAGVTVNGKWAGRTPLTVDQLAFGSYVVRVVQPGYRVEREQVALTARNASQTMNVRLQPDRVPSGGLRTPPNAAPPAQASPAAGAYTGSLFVDSRPQGARVLLDGRTVGKTPMMLSDVRVGTHVVRIELDEHRPWSVTTTIIAGRENRVTGSLERFR